MPLDHKPTQAEFDAVARANAAFHPELRRPRLPPPDLGACSGEGRAYPSFPRRWCTLSPQPIDYAKPNGAKFTRTGCRGNQRPPRQQQYIRSRDALRLGRAANFFRPDR